MNNLSLSLNFNQNTIENFINFLKKNNLFIITSILVIISIISFLIYFSNGLGIAYNDARSHLNIGRRVVEGLKPGAAQLGSVWLPLPHVLMVPTIWNDFMWHSGLSGALVSMLSFIATGMIIYSFLKKLGVGVIGRVFGVAVFATNLNILYLQSTAMTELLLIASMTAAVYELMLWHKEDKILNLIKASFYIMLSTLIRYDGWFLFLFACGLIIYHVFKKNYSGSIRQMITKGYRNTEGVFILFCTLGAFGIFLWLLWNQLIFKDALYFAFGPYSARAQQTQLEAAGNLATKHNIYLSTQHYLYALIYNSGLFASTLGLIGAIILWTDKKIKSSVKIASTALTVPFIFNVLALYLGHSVLFIQGISGNTWFNVRYGVTMVPSIAIFLGFMADRIKNLRAVIIGLFIFVTVFQFTSQDAVTIDDARVGSSQKNVSEVSGWLNENAKDKEGFILISAASHDAIIFSSGLPMSKYIHEGTGKYWESATTNPDRWARWIIMRTHDDNDSTYKAVSKTPDFAHYNLVEKYPFADIYELKSEFISNLNTKPVLGRQK